MDAALDAPNARRAIHWKARLLFVILPAAALTIGALIAALGPWSPLAMAQADALMGWRRPAAALALYEQVGRMGWSQELRAEAHYRAGLVASVELREPHRAVRHLRWHLRLEGTRGIEARLHLARLYARDLRSPRRAARLYLRAADHAPEDPRVSDWLLKAAQLNLQEDRVTQARRLLERVIASHPEQADRARLELARVEMDRRAFVRSYELYQEVAASKGGVEGALARLGLSICLERQGDLEAALAELEIAELPEEILQERLERVSERSRERGL